MSLPVVFLPEARDEFDNAADWYENRQTGAGAKFTRAVDAVIALLANNPRIHAVVLQDVRKAIVPGYPYCVYYREESGNLVVLAVFHTSRDPADWQGRV